VIFATGLPEVVIVKVSSIPCGKITPVALVKVGAVSAANRGAAAKAMKMPDSRMADVRAVQVRILLDGTWQEWFSIDRESGSAIEPVLCQIEISARLCLRDTKYLDGSGPRRY